MDTKEALLKVKEALDLQQKNMDSFAEAMKYIYKILSDLTARIESLEIKQ